MHASDDVETLAQQVMRLHGRAAADTAVKALLERLGAWPLAPFQAGEFHVFFEDKPRGFALKFEDAAVGQPPRTDLPPRTAVLVGGFFYAQGKDGYQQFQGMLPCGMAWNDSAEQLVARLGPPKFTIHNKKTGAVQALRWALDDGMVSANFKADGTLGHTFAGAA